MMRDERTAVGRDRRGFLGWSHPLARVAADRCKAEHGLVSNGVGGVACGRCWERAIRDDERVVVTFGLPRELTPDPSYVDPIAVELACGGEPVRLTRAERRAAAERLTAAGLPLTQVARRLSPRDTAPRPPLPALDTNRAAA